MLAFWIYKGATPGKMVVSARIVDATDRGGPMTKGQAVLRYAGYFVSLLPLGLGYLWVAFDRRKQGWHDKIAGTVVVRGRRGGRAPPVRGAARPELAGRRPSVVRHPTDRSRPTVARGRGYHRPRARSRDRQPARGFLCASRLFLRLWAGRILARLPPAGWTMVAAAGTCTS